MTERAGFAVVVAAPSGTGKTTVCRQVVERDGEIDFSVSHTTRPQRKGEREGEDYYFVDAGEFMRLVASDAFLEWAVYNDNRYGTSWRSLEEPLASGRDVLLEIEVQGARQVKHRLPDARLVFLLPPSFEALRQRLEQRGSDSPEEVERRLQVARKELEAVEEFDYAVPNDDLETCVEAVLAILRAEREGDTAALRERYAPSRGAGLVRSA